jgi:hypothetical protein
MSNVKKSLLTLAAAVLLSASALADTGNVLSDGNLDSMPASSGWDLSGGYRWNNSQFLVSDPSDYYVALRAVGASIPT